MTPRSATFAAVCYAVLATPIALSLVALSAVLERVANSDRVWPLVAHLWARGFVTCCGVTVVGGDALATAVEVLLDSGHPVLIASSHSSYLDTLVLMSQTRRPLRFVAKRELAWIPFLGVAMLATRQLFISRKHRTDANAAMDRAGDALSRTGGVVVVYPEGTRSKDGRVGRFKHGAFRMAARCADCCIVPVDLRGTREVWPRTVGAIYPGRVEVRTGSAIVVATLREEGNIEVHDVVERLRAATEDDVRRLRGP